jgi:hypothetical protein
MAISSMMSTILEQLALIFVTAALLTLPAIALVFTVGRRAAPRRIATRSRFVRGRLTMAAAGIGLGSVGVGLLLGRTIVDSVLAALIIAAAVLMWLPLGRIWAGRGVLAWAVPVVAGSAFLTFGAVWTATAELAPLGLLAGVVLWLLEAIVIGVGLVNLWELIDVRARRAQPYADDPQRLADGVRRPLVSYARRGSMLLAAGAVGVVVFLAPFTPAPELGDLSERADGSPSPPDATVAAPDIDAEELSDVAVEASASPIRPPATERHPSSIDPPSPSDTGRSVRRPTHDAPDRPDENPTPPGNVEDHPGHSDEHPEHPHWDDEDDPDDDEDDEWW